MSSSELKQRLAAILAADVAGYSRLMAADERATVAALDAARAVFRTQIESSQAKHISWLASLDARCPHSLGTDEESADVHYALASSALAPEIPLGICHGPARIAARRYPAARS